MSAGNYLQGSIDSGNNAYNVLLSGAPSGYTSSGLNIGGDTSTMYGVKISKDATNNAFLDLRADMSNKMSLRYKDNSSGIISSMLDLTNDSSLTGAGYGAQVNGRVKASSYYVGSSDVRAPVSSGVYMGYDANTTGYFNMNKGSGSGGFAFKTYNADGSLLQNNLNLLASGVVQASYYTATGNAADSEAVAVLGMDASGNLIRNYSTNARYRALEARMTSVESDITGAVPTKVNEIVSRLNGLNFFSQNIATIATFTPADNNPNNYNGRGVTVPIAPTNVSAVAGNAQATVSFTASSGATSYTVTSSPGNKTATGASSPIIVTGLTNSTSYTFTVTATNTAGTSSASSASSSITYGPSSFPSAPLSANTQTLSDGTYVLTTSPSPSAGGYNTNIFQAFDGNAATSWGAADGYVASTGAYNGSVSTTLSDSSTVLGCWLQIKLPKSVLLTSYVLTVNWAPYYNYQPSSWKLLGSTDGTIWYLIDTQSGKTTSSYTNGVITVTPAFSWGSFAANYYRLVITGCYAVQIGGTWYGDFPMVKELVLNGYDQ